MRGPGGARVGGALICIGGELGLAAACRPDRLDDVVCHLRLGLEDELVRQASVRVEDEDVIILGSFHCWRPERGLA